MLSPQFINRLWYGKHFLSYVLLPLSWLYALYMIIRKLAYASGMLPVQRVPALVIVVGNVTVGGTGKTPLIIWLADFLLNNGYQPGIISRGYGGAVKKWPQQVRADSNPAFVGDEPVLIAQHVDCPVVVSPDRYVAARELLEHTDCDVLLCDDGLQHLSLHRDIEIAVIDAEKRFGNGHCLPAGPLREPVRRLDSVDMIVSNGGTGKNQYEMEYLPLKLCSLQDKQRACQLDEFSGQVIHAVAGIGNPEKFFSSLRNKNLKIIQHIFPDHHLYKPDDLMFNDGLPVVMTEKDAVKCRDFAENNFWYLPIEVKMNNTFEHRLITLLKEVGDG